MENKFLVINEPVEMCQSFFEVGTRLLIKGTECVVESDDNVECTPSVCKNCLLNADGYQEYCTEATCVATNTYFKPIKK